MNRREHRLTPLEFGITIAVVAGFGRGRQTFVCRIAPCGGIPAPHVQPASGARGPYSRIGKRLAGADEKDPWW